MSSIRRNKSRVNKLIPSNIPRELKDLDQWVGWDSQKRPINSGWLASTSNPQTWTSFYEALSWIRPKSICRGVSFVLNGDRYAGFDIDHCRDPETGVIQPKARKVIEELDSYTEVSPSGTGIRMFAIGKLSRPGIVHKSKGLKLEMYQSGRHLSVTGNVWEGHRTIRERDLGDFERKYPGSPIVTGIDVVIEEGAAVPDSDLPTHVLEKLDTVSIKGEIRDGEEVDPSDDDWERFCLLLEPGPHGAELSPEVALATFKKHPCYTDKDHGVIGRKVEHIGNYLQRTLRKAMAHVKKNSGFIVEVEEDIFEEIVNPVNDDQLDLPAECLDGWLGEVCRKHFKRFPRAYAWLSLLAAASVHVHKDTKRCNLYVATVGPVGTAKSACADQAFHTMAAAKPYLLSLKPGSGEGLLEQIGDVGGQPRLLYPDELKHTMEKAAIQHASMSTILTTAFYHDDQTITVNKRKKISYNARLSILGGIVEDEFGEVFGAGSTGGLHSRFLFGLCPSGYKHLYEDLSEEVAYKIELDGPNFPVPVTLDSSVKKENHRWIKDLGIDSRVAELCIRAATVCAGYKRGVTSVTLTGDMLKPALALAKYQMEVRKILQPNEAKTLDGQCANKLLRHLDRHPGQWMLRGQVRHSIHGGDYGPKVFEGCLRGLLQGKQIEMKDNWKYIRSVIDE
jgi:hypothetical protein